MSLGLFMSSLYILHYRDKSFLVQWHFGSPIEENLGSNPFSPLVFKPNKINPCSIGSKSPPNINKAQFSLCFGKIWLLGVQWWPTLTLFPLCNLCNYQKVAYVGQGGPMQLCSPLSYPHYVFLSQINKFFPRIQNECSQPYIMLSFCFW